MKQTIRLNENQLRQVIKESIKKVLKENKNLDDKIMQIVNQINIDDLLNKGTVEVCGFDIVPVRKCNSENVCNLIGIILVGSYGHVKKYFEQTDNIKDECYSAIIDAFRDYARGCYTHDEFD